MIRYRVDGSLYAVNTSRPDRRPEDAVNRPSPARPVRRWVSVAAMGLLTAWFSATSTAAAPHAAAVLGDGEVPAPPLGLGRTLLVFVGAPLALMLGITLLVMMSGALRQPRYRPTQGWQHRPLWFGGPADPRSALAAADTAGRRPAPVAELTSAGSTVGTPMEPSTPGRAPRPVDPSAWERGGAGGSW